MEAVAVRSARLRLASLTCWARPALAALVGCGPTTTSYVKSNDTTLGRVVVYRNGIAYFERYAHVEGNVLKVSVPTDKLDDFLKSLTVTDAKTGQPAPISYPTTLPVLVDRPRRPRDPAGRPGPPRPQADLCH